MHSVGFPDVPFHQTKRRRSRRLSRDPWESTFLSQREKHSPHTPFSSSGYTWVNCILTWRSFAITNHHTVIAQMVNFVFYLQSRKFRYVLRIFMCHNFFSNRTWIIKYHLCKFSGSVDTNFDFGDFYFPWCHVFKYSAEIYTGHIIWG